MKLKYVNIIPTMPNSSYTKYLHTMEGYEIGQNYFPSVVILKKMKCLDIPEFFILIVDTIYR